MGAAGRELAERRYPSAREAGEIGQVYDRLWAGER
jgi:hypothetical protein